MPGPLLSDLHFDGSHREESFVLLRKVQDAFSDEAEAIAGEYELGTTTSPAKISVPMPAAQTGEPAAEGEGDPKERPTVVVRHRFERRTKETAKRIVVLRDRRRGRPSTRHDNDPPG